MKQILCAFALLAWQLVAHADVLPPQAADAAERFRNNPGAYDRTDEWCEGRRVDAACQITGNAFEGGGPGICERDLNRRDYQIDLRCVLKPTPRIERAIPDGPWQADADVCALAARSDSAAQTVRAQGWLCAEPPVLADRFCKGVEVGQRCVAEVPIDGRVQRFDGVCSRQLDTKGTYFQGRRTLTRPVVSCEPEHPVPASTLKPVSAWRKLFQ